MVGSPCHIMTENTYFAPAARLEVSEVLAQLGGVRSDAGLVRTLDAVPALVAVLNAERQVVFANRAFLEMAGGTGGVEGLCGNRPGEILRCIHAQEGPAGCGTSRQCRFCGAAQAILEALRTGASVMRECRITSMVGGRRSSLDLHAEVVPFDIAGRQYLLMNLRDISARVRRSALERIFFHDVLNTVAGLKMQLDLLRAKLSSVEQRVLLDHAETIWASLLGEIQAQKTLLAAESGTLKVQRNLIAARELVVGVIGQFDGQDLLRDRSLVVAGFSEPVSFVSDEVLVRRILINMVKNALEASAPGGAVTVGFRPTGGGVEFRVHNRGSMTEETRAQVFQRSFSTKGDDRGLGTWSMKLLAEDYLGGTVRFTTSPGEGTAFILSLPLAPTARP